MAEYIRCHPQCCVCLKRSCHKGVGPVKKYGEYLACQRCAQQAVQWMYECARKFGGAYPDDFCGYAANSLQIKEAQSGDL